MQLRYFILIFGDALIPRICDSVRRDIHIRRKSENRL